jgi:hypothetical protein
MQNQQQTVHQSFNESSKSSKSSIELDDILLDGLAAEGE